MKNEDVIKRLENIVLPDIFLEGHRQELRASLLREYSRVRISNSIRHWFSFLQFRPALWRSILVTSAAWMLILLAISLSILVPRYQPNTVSAMALNTVMAAPQVKAALASDEVKTVTFTNLGDNLVEVIVESHGGTIIIARVNVKEKAATISEISYVILLGSIYQPEQQITGEEQDRIIGIANTNPAFRKLVSEGADVVKTTAVECIISTRNLDTNTTSEIRHTWAIVQLVYKDSPRYFLVDPENGRVIDRSTNQPID